MATTEALLMLRAAAKGLIECAEDEGWIRYRGTDDERHGFKELREALAESGTLDPAVRRPTADGHEPAAGAGEKTEQEHTVTRVDGDTQSPQLLTAPVNEASPSLVVSYVCEEVARQGHDLHALDGLERVAWMLDAWSYALACDRDKPSLDDAIAIGKLVERHRNKRGLRKVGVRVGPRLCPPPERVPELLLLLFEQRDVLTPLEFYKGFEEVHPFVDGNGRTGKVLLNWLNGTLMYPLFPPSNLWGREIRNP